MTVLESISLNPYRVMGVFASSSKKEIVANIARIKANLRVGKQVSFDTDFTQILPSIIRNSDILQEAESSISLPEGQIRCAQFWFIQQNEFDKIAISNLIVGNVSQAISIWEKKENVSSLQNRIVYYLTQGIYGSAIPLAQKLYTNYQEQFKEAILNEHSNVVNIDLGHSFLDVLCAEIKPQDVIPFLTINSWQEYVLTKAVLPLIKSIEQSIDKAKSTKKQGASARLLAGTTLMNETVQSIRELKQMVSASNVQYSILADKLGLEILQCGIDYYNDSDEDDAAYKALKLQKYAYSIVVGSMAKDRCAENLSILEKIISKLPPVEVMASHKAIQLALISHSILKKGIPGSIELMKKCAQYIVDIKSKLGVTNQYYLETSTSLVNCVLGNVIDEVNEILGAENPPFEKVKSILRDAWHATLYMDKFDLEPDFKRNRYTPNRQSLHDLIDKVKGFENKAFSFRYTYGCGFCNGLQTDDLDLRTEEEIYKQCKTINDCIQYLNRYPNGQFKGKIETKKLELELANCKTIADVQAFIVRCAIPSMRKKAEEKLELLQKQEQERIAREKVQDKALSNCTNLAQVIELYQREKKNCISVDKCSAKAFEYCSSEGDYSKVVSVFGTSSAGGRKANGKLSEIAASRKAREERNKKTRKILIWVAVVVAIVAAIYMIWGIEGIATACLIIAAIAGFGAFGILRSFDTDGCGTFFICLAIAAVFGFSGYGIMSVAEEIENKKKASELYEEIKRNPSIDQCEKYMRDYRHTENADNVRQILLNQLVDNARSYDHTKNKTTSTSIYSTSKTPLEELFEFANDNQSNEFGKEASAELTSICDSLYKIAKRTATIAGWRAYQQAVPSSFFKDSESQIEEIENKSWNTEAKAWSTAKRENTISAYQKYKNLYPKGAHIAQAEKKLIDLEVANVFAGSHGSLPSMDKTSWGNGPTAYISVTNRTSYTLTLRYSGPDSKKLVISPGGTSSVTLKNGRYKVAASVNASNVSNYAGVEDLSGGSYSVEYYISTHRF